LLFFRSLLSVLAVFVFCFPFRFLFLSFCFLVSVVFSVVVFSLSIFAAFYPLSS